MQQRDRALGPASKHAAGEQHTHAEGVVTSLSTSKI